MDAFPTRHIPQTNKGQKEKKKKRGFKISSSVEYSYLSFSLHDHATPSGCLLLMSTPPILKLSNISSDIVTTRHDQMGTGVVGESLSLSLSLSPSGLAAMMTSN